MARTILILALLSTSAGYPAEWNGEMVEARRLCDQNRIEEAEGLYTSALAKAERDKVGSLAVGIVLNDFGYCFHGAGKLLEAEKLYLRSLALLEKVPEMNDRPKLRIVSNLVRLYLERGQTSRTERVLRRFLPPERAPGPRTPEEAVLWGDLGFVLAQNQQIAQAERLIAASIATLQDAPDFHEHAVVALSNLSSIYAQTGKLADATAYSRRARDLLSTASNASATTVIKTFGNAAVLAVLDDDLDQANLWFQEAVTVAEDKLSPKHPLLGHILDLYAQFLHKTRRHKEAGQLAEKAAAILGAFQQENLIGHTVEARSLMRQASAPELAVAVVATGKPRTES